MYGEGMAELIVITTATAFIITAVEELIRPLGVWRGLLALVVCSTGSYLLVEQNWAWVVFTSFGSSFCSMALSAIVNTSIDNKVRTVRGMPRRIPPL